MAKWKAGDPVVVKGYIGVRGRVMPSAALTRPGLEHLVRVRLQERGGPVERTYSAEALEAAPELDPFRPR